MEDNNLLIREELIVFLKDKKMLQKARFMVQCFLFHAQNKGYLFVYTPDDILQETFEKLLSNKRKWNSQKYESFHKFLFLSIRSVFLNIRSKECRNIPMPLEFFTDDSEDDFFSINTKTRDDECLLEIFFNETAEMIKECLAGNSKACEYFNYLLEGLDEDEIVEVMNISKPDLYKIKKVIKYRMKKGC